MSITPPAEIFAVIDEEGRLSHASQIRSMAHDHINDAIQEHEIEGAGKWVVRRYVLAPEHNT